jgi:hypothetical protein
MNQDFDIISRWRCGRIFTAINIVEKNPKLKVDLRTRTEVLQSPHFEVVAVYVTHACFEPNELVKFYPVVKTTRALFINFAQETPSNGLKTRCGAKIEDDGRMFPVSNSSQTIMIVFYKLRPN